MPQEPITITPIDPATAAREASDAAKRAKRDAFLLLDEVFDTEKGCFKSGESDATVGSTVGLSPEAVKTLREEFGYVIKRPAELDGLVQTMTAMEARFAALRNETVQTLDALAAEALDLRRKVEAALRKYG